MTGGGMRTALIPVVRLAGMALGVALLALLPFWASPPSASVGLWAVGVTSLAALGVTLLLPWGRIVRRPFWWVLLVLMVAAILGLAAMTAAMFVWADIHGAVGWGTGAVLAGAAIILAAQIAAIIGMRRAWRKKPPAQPHHPAP